jgi:outer membrane protein assembly factor BamB
MAASICSGSVEYLPLAYYTGVSARPTTLPFHRRESAPRRTSRGARSRRVARAASLIVVWSILGAGLAARAVPPPASLAFPGGVLWQIDLAAPPSSAAAFDDTTAYVPLSNGELTAVRHADGSVQWRVKQGASARPHVMGDTLIVADGPLIVALDTATGKSRWRQTLDDAVSVSPVAGAAVVVVATSSGKAVGLEPGSGRTLWTAALGAPTRFAPAVAADSVYISLDDGRLVSLSLKDGRTLWQRKLGGTPAEPLPAGDRVFVGSKDKYFYSLGSSNGRVKWRWRTGGDLVGRPLVDVREVYFLSLDNLLRAAHRRGGNLRWNASLSSRPLGPAIRADDLILVTTVSQEIRAYKVKDGSPAGSMAMPGRLMGGPFLAPASENAPSRLVILTAAGQLQAIGRTIEPPIVPLDFFPGIRLAPETLPPVVRGPGVASSSSPPPCQRPSESNASPAPHPAQRSAPCAMPHGH